MSEIDTIVKEGNSLSKTDIETKLSIKRDILSIVSKMKDNTFIMNLKMFDWKQKIVSGEITMTDDPSQAEWLLEPLCVYCDDIEDSARHIANELFRMKHSYVKARNDIYSDRLNVDVNFEVAAIVIKTNPTITKHVDSVLLYGARLNFNGMLMVPILLYEYTTPKFNYLAWKENLEIEPFLWKAQIDKWNKHPDKVVYSSHTSSHTTDIHKSVLALIHREADGSYIMTGYYTYYLMCGAENGPYQGDYHVYHEKPEDFIGRIREAHEVDVQEEEPIFYFERKAYRVYYNKVLILTIYHFDYSMNYIVYSGYKHVNYHGVLLFLCLEMLRSGKKGSDDIGYLIKTRNNSKSPKFEILQNVCVGPRTTPQIEFKKKEWNHELNFFHRPNKVEDDSDLKI